MLEIFALNMNNFSIHKLIFLIVHFYSLAFVNVELLADAISLTFYLQTPDHLGGRAQCLVSKHLHYQTREE